MHVAARRDDGRFEGLVAVKLLALSMAGAGRAERFRRAVEGTTFDVGSAKLNITISAGVAVVPTRQPLCSGV